MRGDFSTSIKEKSPRVIRNPRRRGGAKGNRTPDLLHAKQPLYHLSYNPTRTLKSPLNIISHFYGDVNSLAAIFSAIDVLTVGVRGAVIAFEAFRERLFLIVRPVLTVGRKLCGDYFYLLLWLFILIYLG